MIREVTSLANPTVKAVRALHMRKERAETGLFLAEGLKIVTEAVELGHPPKTLLYAPEEPRHPLLQKAIEATSATGGEVVEVTPAILGKIARRDNPQAVLGVFEQRLTSLSALVPASAPCWVGLEMVRDPGNLGTIIRTADAAGCGGVILIGECCDPWSVESVRASMGSIFATPVVKTTTAEFLAWRESWPGSVVGTLLSADVDYRKADYRAPTLLLMGNEQQGLTPEMASACDVAVKIPMRGRADSLNLAVATGVMIYAAS